MKLDHLPEDSISHVLSFTSPREACQSSLVSSTFRDAAESEILWEKFLPSDYRDILSRLVTPVTFKSKKDLFFRLSTPHLIDGGNKTFAIDKVTGKKCYTISARELYITWSTNPHCWCWKPILESRFAEATELIMVCWLEIKATISSGMLSPNTTYGAYLIIKFENRAFGLETLPSEVSVEVGNYQSRGTIYLRQKEVRKQSLEGVVNENKSSGGRGEFKGDQPVASEREDGWLEIELGEFYNEGSGKDVKLSLSEAKGEHLKGGLVVEGIEVRPKY